MFRVLNGKLYITGHDSRESWSFGNYYVNDGLSWTKFRNIPGGIHVFDMAFFKGKYFVGNSTTSPHPIIAESDDGISWTTVVTSGSGWTHDFFEFKGKLYATSMLITYSPRITVFRGVIQIDVVDGKTTYDTIKINNELMYPGIIYKTPVRMARVNALDDKIIYICGQEYNDQQWLPLGLYQAADINAAARIDLPSNAVAMDILTRENNAYVLAHVKVSNNQYPNVVFKSNADDLANWSEVLRFDTDTFARSFEELNGDFYFGLGCNTDILPSSTGTILKVKG